MLVGCLGPVRIPHALLMFGPGRRCEVCWVAGAAFRHACLD